MQYSPWSVCLQIGSLSVGQEAETHFVQLYVIFMNQLVTVLPITADIPKAYQQGSDDEQEFVQNLAIFLTGFLKVKVYFQTPVVQSQLLLHIAYTVAVQRSSMSSAILNILQAVIKHVHFTAECFSARNPSVCSTNMPCTVWGLS